MWNLQTVKRYEMTKIFSLFIFMENSAFVLFPLLPSHSAGSPPYRHHNKLFERNQNEFLPSLKTRLTNSFHPNKDYTFLCSGEGERRERRFVLDVFNGFSCCQRYCLVMFLAARVASAPSTMQRNLRIGHHRATLWHCFSFVENIVSLARAIPSLARGGSDRRTA